MPVNENQVLDIAQQLRDQGIKVSAISIREVLRTGSLSTIQKYLNVWREKGVESSSGQTPPPQAAVDAALKMINQVWGISLYYAAQDAGLKVKEAREELLLAKEEAAEAWKEVERLETEDFGLKEKLEEYGREKNELLAAKEELSAGFKAIRDENTALSRSLADQESRCSELGRKLDAEIAGQKSMAEKLQHSEAKSENLLRKNFALERAAEDARARLDSSAAREAELQEYLKSLRSIQAVLEERVTVACREREAAMSENARLKDSLARSEGRLGEMERVSSERAGLLEQVAVLSRALTMAHERIVKIDAPEAAGGEGEPK